MAGNTENGARRGSRWSPAVWGGAAALLLVPLAAMQFTREVAWSAGDFAVMGALLALVCGAFELVTRATGNLAYRAGAGVAVATSFLLIWVNLAVGFIGDEGDPANLMFGGVLAVAFVGAAIVRFRAGGMAGAMVVTAVAQALVALIAFSAGLDIPLIPTAVFVGLWLGSAALFRLAARGDAAA